jgi:small subunit ribosomal protein S2
VVEGLIKQLLEAGVHFGHPTKRWNPKMKKYIFGNKAGVYIIDLEKTVECLNRARDFLMKLVADGKIVLFVGTKKQAQTPIQEEAQRCGMYYINQRWLGGLLTNFNTIKKRISRLKDIERMKTDGTFEVLTKKEVSHLTKEMDRLKRNFSGIVEMSRIPDAVYLIDSMKERTALREALRLNLPVVALIDTNCDPDEVTFPIPGNDDALRSIKLITSFIADSVIEGKKKLPQAAEVERLPEEAAEKVEIEETIKEAAEEIEEKEVEVETDRPKAPKVKKERPGRVKPKVE